MKLIVKSSRLNGEITVPGSKSHTIRGIIAALQSEGVCTLRAPLASGDTLSVLRAAELFGAKVARSSEAWRITGLGGRLHNPYCVVDLDNSGTGLRLLTALAAKQDFPITFDGDASLRSRSMRSLLDSLSQLGAVVQGDHCPFTICGPIRGGEVSVDGKSSQFLTALLMTLPTLAEDSVITLNSLNEQPYALITARWLDRLGIRYAMRPDLLRWEVPGNQRIGGFDATIPADFSTACFALAGATLAGGEVAICNLDFSDAQGDKAVFGFFEAMGAKIVRGKKVTVCGGVPLAGGVFDLNATPDALPVMAVTAALSCGETRLVNVAQARGKECDRIAVMCRELAKMGAKIAELPDGLIITGGTLHGVEVESYGDHRVAMALALAGMRAEGTTTIAHAEGIPVSYPGFIRDFQALGADFTVIG